MQLTAAVHDMDIDHLLQKLICGEIEYNPHDPNRYAACRLAFIFWMACSPTIGTPLLPITNTSYSSYAC